MPDEENEGLEALIKRLSRYDIFIDGIENQATVSALRLTQLIPLIRAAKEYKSVSESMPGIVRLMRKEALKQPPQEAVLDEVDPINAFAQAIADDEHRVRRLIWHKMLEEIVICSEDEMLWREAMWTLSRPIHEMVVGQEAAFDLRLCASCLVNIFRYANEEPAMEALAILTTKRDLVQDILAGGLFQGDEKVEVILDACQKMPQSDMLLAAFLAFNLSHMEKPCDFMPKLLLKAETVEPGRGPETMLGLINGDLMRAPDLAMRDRVLRGFGRILNAARIMLPHGEYDVLRGSFGMPIPLLHHDGLHMLSLRSLRDIGTGRALLTMTQGIAQLVLPHIDSIHPNLQGRQSVLLALPEISGMFHELARQNGLLPLAASDMTSMLMGQPRSIPPEVVDPGRLMLMSPILSVLAFEAYELGAHEAPMTLAAAEGVCRGLLSGVVHPMRMESQGIMLRNAETVVRLNDHLFKGRGSQDAKERTREFLKRVMERHGTTALPPGNGRARNRR